MQTATQFFRYVIVGVGNTILDFSIVNALSIAFGVYSGVPIIFVNTAAAATVIIQSYLLNKYWVFRAPDGAKRIELPKFILVNLGAGVLNTSVVYIMTTYLVPPAGVGPLLWENIAKVVGLGGNVLWNFLGFKLFVFRVAPPL